MEPLAKIFGSPARLKALRLFAFNQDTAFSPADIATRAKLSREVVQGELAELVASGLLRKSRRLRSGSRPLRASGKGARSAARYQVNARFEHLPALNAFIRETTSVRPQKIIAALKRAGALRLVVLSGHFSGILEPQIDLLVVGDHLDERSLAHAVHALEAELGREIRYASFATVDFRYRLGVYDRLLRDVFDYPHRVLIDKIGL